MASLVSPSAPSSSFHSPPSPRPSSTSPASSSHSPSTPPTTSSPPPSSSPSLSPSSSSRGYLKLLFETFEYVLPSSTPSPPSLTLGRKLPMHTPSILPIAADRNISRQHARLQWVPRDRCWWVECLGKNGMFVGDAFVAGGGRVRLEWEEGDHVKMQIGEVIFFVIHPLRQPEQQQG